MAALGLALIATVASAAAEAEETRRFAWTRSAGVSYPLVGSVSGGGHVPIYRGFPFDTVAVQANIDVGIGGGMVSAGVYLPAGGDRGVTSNAIVGKAAVLRTWCLGTRGDGPRTYSGFVVEHFKAAAGMGGKIGLGYFRSNRSVTSSNDGLLYLYAGLGI